MNTTTPFMLALLCALGLTLAATAEEAREESFDGEAHTPPAGEAGTEVPPSEQLEPAEATTAPPPSRADPYPPVEAGAADAEAALLREMEAMVRAWVAEAMAAAFARQQANGGTEGETLIAPPALTPSTTPSAPASGAAQGEIAAPRGSGDTNRDLAAERSGQGDGLRMNFRNAPIELVLDYLADAAGFTVILDTPIRGAFDVWNVEPLNREEAVALLNTVLNKKGYAVARQGRTLTVYSATDRPPVIRPVGGPEDIVPTDELVTQIIQVRHVSASQLIRDLQPLLPSSSMTLASDGGNKIVIQDSRANIRRMYEIIDALDTPQATVATIKVIPLRHSDARTLATVLSSVYAGQEADTRTSRSNPFQQFFQGSRGRSGN